LTESEKIEYQPVTVRETLTEMKNLSEVMIDLAYSAALFHSHELAEEVLELEKRVGYLTYLLNMSLMLAARDADDAESLVGITTVASATNEIAEAAADIASLVLQEVGLHPIVRDVFTKIEERLVRLTVNTVSLLTQQKLGELDLAARIGIDIIALRRGKQWIIDPSEEEMIRLGDVLIARGAPLGIEKLKAVASGALPDLE
jgi:uncharacterized protein with PhoU and TrkA domain